MGALVGTVMFFVDRKLRPYAVPVTAFPILFPFASYMSQALLRYRYPIDPMALLLGAVAVAGLAARARARLEKLDPK
jgi:hypothetical protein